MYFHFLLLNLFTKGCGPTLRHTWVPITQGWSVPSLGQTDSVFLEKKIVLVTKRMQFHIVSLLSPIRKKSGLFFNKVEFVLPKNALCQVWLKLAHSSGEKNTMHFHYVAIILYREVVLHQRIDSLYQVWLELHGPSLGEVYENVKSLQSDDGKQAIRKAHGLKSSGN